jgi:hypothetical protein
MTKGRSVNVDEFRDRPVNEIAAICQTREPSRPRSRIWRLPTSTSRPYGCYTARRVFKFLIQAARNTALGTHLVRGLQGLGYPRNILDVYEEAVDKDESLITVPCDPGGEPPFGRLMLPMAHRNRLRHR